MGVIWTKLLVMMDSVSIERLISMYTTQWLPLRSTNMDDCPICLMPLLEPTNTRPVHWYNFSSRHNSARKLKTCDHVIHRKCLENMLKHGNAAYLQCPCCKTVQGVRMGTRPLTGTIQHTKMNVPLPGYERFRTIEILFNFQNGIQGSEHPNPGQYFEARGFPRKAYLPDSREGIRALYGLYKAWEQRLIFTVGRSLTTNQNNVVTFDSIHLKTKISALEHGYPDPSYLSNLFDELKGFGITDAVIDAYMRQHPNLV